MMHRSREAKALLRSAHRDLEVAQLALKHDPAGLAEVVFAHCQDAVGRMLAAYLVASECPLAGLHDQQSITRKARELHPALRPLLKPISRFAEHFLACRHPCEDAPEFTAENAGRIVYEVELLEKHVRDMIEPNRE